MDLSTKIMGAAAVVFAAGAGYLRQKRRSTHALSATRPAETTRQLLVRAAPLLRLPTSPDAVPDVLPDGSGLRCPRTGQVYLYRNSILDLLEEEPVLTDTQRALDTHFTAWIYDRVRDRVLALFGGLSFPHEVALIQQQLDVQPGSTVLDLACGHGNFTDAWARRSEKTGLVIGLDLSRQMLHRAAMRMTQANLTNVLLIRGDAQRLPFADGAFSKINCSGGFHQLPDLPRALHELSRITAPGGTLTASTFVAEQEDPWAAVKRWLNRRFAFHFVPLEWLTKELAAAGFADIRAMVPGAAFGYISGRKAA